MPDPTALTLLDAALWGGLQVLVLLVSQVLWRDRPALPATPLIESRLHWAWQMPLIAVSVANVVLFWLFVRALFDDDFRLAPCGGFGLGGRPDRRQLPDRPARPGRAGGLGLGAANPVQRDLPVLTIALDAGFQSIGPFNRAFKTATGLTPTEFRRGKLADS